MGKLFLSLVLVPLIGGILFVLNGIDFFKKPQLYDERYTDCKLEKDVPSGVGPEDMDRYNSTTLVYANGDFLQLFLNGEANLAERGTVHAIYNADKVENNYISKDNYRIEGIQVLDFPEDVHFQPHGIYTYTSGDEKYLFMINHGFRSTGERVEVFRFEQGADGLLQLRYQYSFVLDDYFNGITNDVVALSPTHIIVTQWQPFTQDNAGAHHNPPAVQLSTMKVQLLKEDGCFLYSCRIDQITPGNRFYKPNCTKIPAGGATVNNGLTYDGEYIYVVDSLQKNVRKFKVNLNAPEDKLLELVKNVPIDVVPDNIAYDPENGVITISGMMRGCDFFKMKYLAMKNNGKLPSGYQAGIWAGIYEITDRESMEIKPVRIGYDDAIGVSVAYMQGDNLFLGSFGDRHLAVCKRRK